MKDFLGSIIFPSKHNDHRAYLARPLVVLSTMFCLLMVNIGWLSLVRTSVYVKGVSTDLTPSQIISLTNLERSKAGVVTLRPNDKLNLAAEAKARNMIATGNFDHYYQVEGTGVTPWQFIIEAEYEYLHAGENLGRDFSTAEDLVKAWVDSPAHRSNLLSDQFSEMGVAVIEGLFLDKENTTVIVQIFASPLPEGVMRVEEEDGTTFRVTPMLQREESWVDDLFQEYPNWLFYITVGITSVVGVTLLIDVVHFKRKKLDPLSPELWYH